MLAGSPGPHRDIVLVNAAAALVAAGRVDTFLEGMAIGTVPNRGTDEWVRIEAPPGAPRLELGLVAWTRLACYQV